MKRILISIILAMPVFVSCKGSKDKVYAFDEYKVGMYINGREYHNTASPDGDFGLSQFFGAIDSVQYAKDSILHIRGAVVVSPEKYSLSVPEKAYAFIVDICVKYGIGKEGAIFPFTPWSNEYADDSAIWNKAKESGSCALCRIVRYGDSECFDVKSGSISFEYVEAKRKISGKKIEYYYAFEHVQFNMLAESDNDDTLTITEGFYNINGH